MALQPGQYEALLGLLAAHIGRDVTILDIEELRAGRVFKVRIGPRAGMEPITLFAKAADDQVALQGGRAQFENERASLQFVRSLDPALAPQIVACDDDALVMVLHEVEGVSLSDLLMHGDAASARDGLNAFATMLGVLHRLTAGRQEQFHGRAADRRLFLRSQDLQESRRQVVNTAALPDWTPAVEDEFDAVLGTLRDPGDFLAFSNGDPCPDNVVRTRSGAAVLDFEVGAFRHALLDAAYLTVPFPNCWCWSPMPPDVAEAVLVAYRAAWRPGPWSSTEHERFAIELVRCRAAWIVNLVSTRLGRGLLEQDRRHPLFTERQRLVAVLSWFAQDEASGDALPALATWAGTSADALASQWVEANQPLPHYPAFGEPPATS